MTYYTGCDAHLKNCTFQHMDEEGALGLTMTVSTDKNSIYKFLDVLDEPTIMTLEAGRNWWHLYHLFNGHSNVFEVNVVDPGRSRNIAKELSVQSGYGRASNDRIYGEMLAEQTRRGIVPKIHIPTPKQMKLRTLNRYRTDSVIIRTATKNKIHALFAMYGTKAKIDDLLEDTKIFDKINLKYAFVEAAHTLRKYPKFTRKYDLDVKKHGKIIAKLNLARKICKTVYWMLTRQQPYKE